MAQKLIDADLTFFRGAKSDTDPGQLPIGYYFSGVNVINQGGVISCRPGYRCVITFPEGNLQGAEIFRPKIGLEQLVAVVDGRAFVAEFPFTSFRQLENIQFSASAKQIFFVMAEQSARRLSDDFASAIEVIEPRAVMFMQDGGETAPAFYDGTEAEHIRDLPFETPIGSTMQWVGDRLWVATGAKVRASDIANPFSFREGIYLGGNDAFLFDGDVTAFGVTPSLEIPQLLVYTDTNCSILKANIRTRSDWPNQPDFQREIFKVGCSSQRSVVSHFGQLMWFTGSGIVFFDSAFLSQQSARLPLRDSEMAISKIRLSGDLSLVAGAAFGQYMLMSVPSDDQYNQHTWVLNNASMETLTDESGPSWSGLWTGTRPVQWIYGMIAGQNRIYYVSKDDDGQNRLWEAFTPDRLDNGCPIMWAVEFRAHFGQTTLSQKPPGEECQFRYAQFALTAIEEGLDIAAYFAGGLRGAYKQIMNRFVSVERGNLDYNEDITADSELFALKAQSRKLRTQDVNDMPLTDTGSCPVEQLDNENVDESFQILLVGHGPATLRWMRSFATPEKDEATGDPATACGREEPVNAIRFDGAGSKNDTFAEASLALSASLIPFTSNQTAVLEFRGISAVGVGFAESIVSQEAADRIAQRIAVKMAENEIGMQLTPVLSGGADE